MGLFGGKSLGDAARYGGGGNWADKVMLIGAALKDASSGGTDNMANIMQLQAARQKMLVQQQLGQRAAALFQGQLDPNAPSALDMVQGQMAGDPNAPTAQQVGARIAPSTSAILPQLAQLQAQGLDVTPYLSMADKMKPDIQSFNGMLLDKTDPRNVGRFIPQFDKGQAPVMQGNQVVDVQNLPNAVQAAADMAGGVAGAQEAGKAPYSFVQTTDGTGHPVWRRLDAASMAAGANGGVLDRGMSPAEMDATKIRETAAANAAVDLPSVLASGQQALSLINSIKSDPALPTRVGLHSYLPAIRGTPGAGFDAKVEQLHGKVFMDAYQALKGGGQITEVEGHKAEAAIARISTAQNEKDFKAALDELAGIVQTGMNRAQSKAVSPSARGNIPVGSVSYGGFSMRPIP